MVMANEKELEVEDDLVVEEDDDEIDELYQ